MHKQTYMYVKHSKENSFRCKNHNMYIFGIYKTTARYRCDVNIFDLFHIRSTRPRQKGYHSEKTNVYQKCHPKSNFVLYLIWCYNIEKLMINRYIKILYQSLAKYFKNTNYFQKSILK